MTRLGPITKTGFDLFKSSSGRMEYLTLLKPLDLWKKADVIFDDLYVSACEMTQFGIQETCRRCFNDD